MIKYIQNHNMNPKRKLELRETANKKIGEICSHTYEEFDDLHILAISEMTHVKSGFHTSASKKDMEHDFNEGHYTMLKSMHDVTRKNQHYHIMSMYDDKSWELLRNLIDNLQQAKSERAFLEIITFGKMQSKNNIADRELKMSTVDSYKKSYAYVEELFLKAEAQWGINMEYRETLEDVHEKFDVIECRQKYMMLKTYVDFEKTQLEILLPFLMEFCVNPSNQYVTKSSIPTTPITPIPSNTNNSNTMSITKQPLQRKIVEVVRKKDERKSMYGHTCNHCEEFYKNMYPDDEEKRNEMIQNCSKHKTRYKEPQPGTPEGFWDLDIQTPPEWKEQDEELARAKKRKIDVRHTTESTTNITTKPTIKHTLYNKKSTIVEDVEDEDTDVDDMMGPSFTVDNEGWIQTH